jgi:hypothetical protein
LKADVSNVDGSNPKASPEPDDAPLVAWAMKASQSAEGAGLGVDVGKLISTGLSGSGVATLSLEGDTIMDGVDCEWGSNAVGLGVWSNEDQSADASCLEPSSKLLQLSAGDEGVTDS